MSHFAETALIVVVSGSLFWIAGYYRGIKATIEAIVKELKKRNSK